MAAQADPGTLLTYAELGEALGIEPGGDQTRVRIRQAVGSARPTLLTDHHRALVPVRGEGYRVALPGEYAGMAENYRDRANRNVDRALAHIVYADESKMTPDELRRHRAVGLVVRNLHGRMTSAEKRLEDLEAIVFGPGPQIIPGKVEDA
jgi:hypothetical protein